MRRLARGIVAGVWCLLLLLLAACAGEPVPGPPPPTLTPFPPFLYIGLSDSAAPWADLVGPAYTAATGNAAPIFLAGNDEFLRQDVQQGALEAATVYELPPESKLWFTPVALDGVVIIVHPDLGVDNLTGDQLRGILSGSITNWAEVGGPNLAINVLNREPGAGARDILLQRIMGNANFSGLARIAATDEYMQQQVVANPGSIGYTLMAGARAKVLGLDGHDATPETIADQSYPLTTPLYFVAQAEPGGPLRDFLAWIQSPHGQAVLDEKYGRVG
jgi:phosphate transport system substrate-binding protein